MSELTEAQRHVLNVLALKAKIGRNGGRENSGLRIATGTAETLCSRGLVEHRPVPTVEWRYFITAEGLDALGDGS